MAVVFKRQQGSKPSLSSTGKAVAPAGEIRGEIRGSQHETMIYQIATLKSSLRELHHIIDESHHFSFFFYVLKQAD